MKVIKLPIQHYYGKIPPPDRIFVKIDGVGARPFEDKECTKPLNEEVGLIYMELTVPDEMEVIEVPSCGVVTPAQDVALSYAFGFVKGYKGVCKLEIIWDEGSYEVPVNDGIVDFENWKYFLGHGEIGPWLFAKRWILEVWTLEDKTVGVFRFHQDLIKQLFIPKEIKDLTICLTYKHQSPSLWEEGGRELKGPGSATIICAPDGHPKKPIFVEKKQGSSKHALLRIKRGDIVINAAIDSSNNERFEILQIESIDKKNRVAKVFKIAEYSGRMWRCKQTADRYKNAYIAALGKVRCVNCDKPFFVYEKQF